MVGENRFVAAYVAIDQALDQLVALRIEAPLRLRLRNATAQLPVAQIMIRRDRYFFRGGDGGFRGILPVDMDLIEVDAVVLKDFSELRAAGGHHDVRRT